MAKKLHTTEEREENSGYERRDLNFRSLMITAIGLLGLMIFGLVISWIVYHMESGEAPKKGTVVQTFVAPGGVFHQEPRLQSDPHAELLVMRAREDSILSSYGWVDKKTLVVRVPIQRAMEMTVAEGLPSVEK